MLFAPLATIITPKIFGKFSFKTIGVDFPETLTKIKSSDVVTFVVVVPETVEVVVTSSV